ncbi:MFS transporter [Actinoallomurus iriomotensis]|uniref:MFS transporter n=1 Tax=Actinoallomurus iriomotensis TaxID=478107 RepID=A0A9W6VWF9_9ACTN|nr:MFS transporter [Actinoallomurus iriomotensis]GLY82805.1 MFS transporter [Actinoallomurus iriomotensis]
MAFTHARIPAIARDPRFLALWTAQSVSTFGDALTTLTLILLITERTHSLPAVGALTVVIAVPAIVIGLLSGAYADRWDRRRTMIASDFLRAVLLGVLAAVVLFTPTLFPVYAIALAQAAVGTFFNPARAALMQVIVPSGEQVRANSLIQTTTVIGELAGTTLAGLLVMTLHTYWVSFTVDAVTFAASAVLISTIPRPSPTPAEEQQSTWAAITDGMRAVRSSPALRALLLVFSALTFALSPMAVLLTPYVVDTLHISTGWVGLIQSGDTAGNILGGVLIALLARRVRPRALIIFGMSALAALIASLAWTTTVVGLLAAYLVFGLLTVAIQTGIGALTQTEVDNALMGRFIGLMSIVPSTVSVLAMTFSGLAGAALGIQNIFLISGAVLATATVLSWRSFRRASGERPAARSSMAGVG